MQNISLQDTILYPSTVHRAVESFASYGNRRFTVLVQAKDVALLRESEGLPLWKLVALRVAQVVLFPITLLALFLKWSWRESSISIGADLGAERGFFRAGDVQGEVPKSNWKNQILKAFRTIPNSHDREFLGIIGSLYKKCKSEGASHKDSLTAALVEAVSILIYQELKESNPNLEPYMCVITQTLVGVDSVYLRADRGGKPLERYHKEALIQWINLKSSDPVTRGAVRIESRRRDRSAVGEIAAICSSSIYSKISVDLAFFPKMLPSDQSVLDAVLLSYPVAKEAYLKKIKEVSATNDDAIIAAKDVLARAVNLLDELFQTGVDISQLTSAHLEEML